MGWFRSAQAAAVASLLLLPAAAPAQTVPGGYSPERLMPEGGQAVQSDGNLRGRGSDDEITGSGYLRAPLWQGEDAYLMLQGEAFAGHAFDDEDRGYWGGAAGLIWRQGLTPTDAWGMNAFVDLGSSQGFAGQGSLGLEYEHLGARGTSYRGGGNLYVPFQDYTEARERGRAPRLGGDLYLGVGQDHGWHRLEGFVTGFHYAETVEAEGLWGVSGELEYRYAGLDFLPTGSHLYASLGARWDTIDGEVSPLFGVGLSVAFWDDGGHERVADVRRNIAYGSPFVPIDYKASGCQAGDVPFEQAVDLETVLSDYDQDFGEQYPPGTPVAQVIPQVEIEAMCQGFGDCLAAVNSYVLPGFANEGLTTIHFVKPANSCDGRIELEQNAG